MSDPITFILNPQNDFPNLAEQVTLLYTDIGWNQNSIRNSSKTLSILQTSLCTVIALNSAQKVIGFGRVLGDAYIAQIVDIMTHTDYRRRGIATQMLTHLTNFLKGHHQCAMLVDGSGYQDFYKKFGFEAGDAKTDCVMYWENKDYS